MRYFSTVRYDSSPFRGAVSRHFSTVRYDFILPGGTVFPLAHRPYRTLLLERLLLPSIGHAEDARA